MTSIEALESIDESKRQARLEQLAAAEKERQDDRNRRRQDQTCAVKISSKRIIQVLLSVAESSVVAVPSKL